MSVAVLDRQAQRPFDDVWRARDTSRDQERRSDGGVGRTPLLEIEPDHVRTLNELVTDTWESLMVRATACCPACNGRMDSRADTPGEVVGECVDCGARLC
jgi:hypothetical protein